VSRGQPVLVAPDKFKGTWTAHEVALAIARGLSAGGIEAIELAPVADGGEGTMEALVRALGGRMVTAEVVDALGRPVTAAFGLVGTRTAIVEMAQPSGLWRIADFERDPLAASTRGTGELIDAAIEAGVREVIVTAGGSATTDGGRGALEALGARFTARKAELSELRKRLRGIRVTVACDVRNPMCGPQGAARIFAPQKGATPGQVEELEQRLIDWSRLAKRASGRDPAATPMAGAAGGLAGGLWAFAGAELKPGAALVLDVAGFDERMRRSHAVITGEGRLDETTLDGKALFELATRSRQAGVPCYGVVGRDELDAFAKRLMNVEVEDASGRSGTADLEGIERAAGRIARRL
jgi:glycerate kinase